MPLTITEEMMKQDPFFQRGLEKGFEKGKLEAKREDIVNYSALTDGASGRGLSLHPEDPQGDSCFSEG